MPISSGWRGGKVKASGYRCINASNISPVRLGFGGVGGVVALGGFGGFACFWGWALPWVVAWLFRALVLVLFLGLVLVGSWGFS